MTAMIKFDEFHHIQSPMQEVQFWKDLSEQTTNSTISTKAAAIEIYSNFKNGIPALEYIQTHIGTNMGDEKSQQYESNSAMLQNKRCHQSFDFLEKHFTDGSCLETTLYNVFQVVDQHGNFIYSSQRMKHMINLISIGLCKTVRSIFPSQNLIFKADASRIKTLVLRSKDILISYLTMVGRLTKIDFSLREKDPWKQNLGYKHEKVDKLMYRIDTTYSVWATNDEVLSILSPQDKKDFKRLGLLQPFTLFDPLNVFDNSDSALKSALYDFNTRLQPLESQILDCIQEQTQNLDAPSFVVLSTFEKLPHVLNRQGIKKNLHSFIIRLNKYLKELITTISISIDESIVECNPVDAIFKCRQYKRKVEKIRLGFKEVAIGDFIEINCMEMCKKCSNLEKKIFNIWLNKAIELLKTSLDFLEQRESLIEIDDCNLFRVTFHDNLAKLINQERKLRLLDFNTQKVAEKITIAKKYYKLGCFLNKSIMVRNSIENQLPLEQRDLLQKSLTEFDELVEKHCKTRQQLPNKFENFSTLSWTNDSECDRFASTLNNIANKLSIETQKISNIHLNTSRRICDLYTHDLLSQKLSWLRCYHEIEEVISKQDSNPRSNWGIYWAHQLFKTIEVTYRKGLLKLNKFMKGLRCELIIKGNDRVDIQPSLSEIRAEMYAQLQAFVEYPCKHQSIFRENGLFNAIPIMNEKAVTEVYRLCERYIADLKELINHYSSQVIVNIEISLYAKSYCHKAKDFAVTLDWLETKKRLVEKWPEIETVQSCMKVSLRKLKNIFEDRLLFFQDSMKNSLESSALRDYQFVVEFMSTASFLLIQAPNEVDEIFRVENDWKFIKQQLSHIEHKATSSHSKFELLTSFSGQTNCTSQSFLDKKDEMKLIENKRWEALIDELHSFADKIYTKKEAAKIVLENDISQHEEATHLLQSHWKSRGESGIESCDEEECIEIGDFLSKCNELKEKHEQLQKKSIWLGMKNHLTSELLETLYKDILCHKEANEIMIQFKDERKHILEKKWKGFDLKDLHNFLIRWKSRVEGLSNNIFKDNILNKMLILDKSLLVLKYCRGDAYKDEHWAVLLYEILCIPNQISSEKVTLYDLMQNSDKLILSETMSLVQKLQQRAQEEQTLSETLDEVIVWFKSFSLVSVNDKYKSEGAPLFTNLTKSICENSDQLEKLTSLKDSIHFKSISDLYLIYEIKLLELKSITEKLNQVQDKWLHLRAVYSSGTMKTKKDLFDSVDSTFYSIISRNQNIKIKCLVDRDLNPDLCAILEKLLVDLEECQQCLFEFLEEKRYSFPRLYFLGDESLLEMLAHSKQPDMLQVHIKHLFQAIHRVVFDSMNHIISFKSAHNEEIVLRKTIDVKNVSVEKWLHQLCEEQKSTLLSDLILSFDSQSDLFALSSKISSQVVCLYDRINFSRRIESILVGHQETLVSTKEDLCQKVNYLATNTVTTSDSLQQRKEHSLILQMIHHRDVVETLIKNRACHCSNWIWQSQLRFSFKDKVCKIRIGDALFEYSFEYQGNEESLVYTKLTDKCFLNLTQAMRFGFGGNPYGPAGTGKTESVKALGALFGRQVLVFNCDDELNYKSIGRMFIGLVMSGAWGCFDEFNRLKEDQLSVIADQIQCIQHGLKRKEKKLSLLQKTIPINHHVAIFITMNPAGVGYGGRSNLPSNLKVLFRPIAMGFPDKCKIAEVGFLSDGFCHAKCLSKKLVHFFSSAQSMLSSKRHYDWGLRSLKSIIRSAGENRRRLLRKIMTDDELLNIEIDIVISSTRDSVISKLNQEDMTIFQGLLKQTFQQSNTSFSDESKIKEILQSKKEYDEEIIEKVVQLERSLDIRTGCIIVGDVKSGKSHLWKTLKMTICNSGEFLETFVVNPKALPRDHLFGKLDSDTGEWKDGVITALVRKALLRGEKAKSWIICDGDIDPEWIESLNSVLDDNCLLTLPTGERLSLSPYIKFIFETRDLTFASPATISRNAIICMNKEGSEQACIVQELDTLQAWASNNEHFILVGQIGCGRDSLINKVFLSESGTEIRTIYCDENTTPQDVINIIEECCSLCSTSKGLVYRPLNSKKIVLVLKNIECVGFDRYGSSTLFAFFHHWFDYGGFYDKDTQFIWITSIQIIFITAQSETLTKKSTHVFERLKKKMKIGVKTLLMTQDIIEQTSARLTQKALEMRLSKTDEHENIHLAKMMVNVLNTAKEFYTLESYCGAPLYTLSKWVNNLTKYTICPEIQKEYFAFEARRSIENLIFHATEIESIAPLIKNTFHRNGIEYNSSYCFSPSSFTKFSLISVKDMYDHVIKSIDFHHDLDVYLNDDVLHSLSDIQHGLYTGTKNVLLLGQCSSGRKTLVKLACQINSIEYVTPMVPTDWDVSIFRAQLRQNLIKTGIDKERVCIHIEEHMLTETKMISMICQILSGCDTMLGTFFDSNELKKCFSRLQHDGFTLERDTAHAKQIFMSNIKEYLHVCISLRPLLKKERLIQRYPSLGRDIEIVLMRDWNQNSLKKIIQDKCDKVFDKIDYEKERILEIILKLHESTKDNLCYLSSQIDLIGFIEIWSRLFSLHNEKIRRELTNLYLGLKKLSETNDEVKELKRQSKEVEKNVINAQSAADEAMVEITTEMTASHLKMNETKDLKLNISEKSLQCEMRKEAIESEIAIMRPALEASQEAVKGIKRGHINEIKSFKTPPQPICDVLSGVLLLQGIKDLSWNSMKAFLAKRGVIEDILNFDAKTISEETLKEVKVLVKKKKKSFDKTVISRVSAAAAPLAEWVIANLDYINVLTTVKPLETELNDMRTELNDCKSMLALCEKNIIETDNRVNELKSKFTMKIKEAETLKNQLSIAKKRSDLAIRFLEQLDGEKQRWKQQIVDLEKHTSSLWAETLLHSAFVAYLGNENEERREDYKKRWLDLFQDIYDYKDCDVLKLYHKEKLRWRHWGLHHNNLSYENAAIIASGFDKIPYILDPNEMALPWLKHFVLDTNSAPLDIVQANDERLHNRVELCVKNGRCIIIKDCNGIEPYLYPLIRNEMCYEDSRYLVTLGTKKVCYNNNFKLFLISKGSCPNIAARIVRIVNFSVTQSGLESRLLSILIDYVRPNLEDELNKLSDAEGKSSLELTQMESRLLEILCSVQGDLLENEEVTNTLFNVRENATKISNSLRQINKAKTSIHQHYEEWISIAKEGSNLYFILFQVHVINNFYRFSKKSFEYVFKRALSSFTDKKTNIDRSLLWSHVMRTILLTFAASINNEDRLVYFLHIIHGMNSEAWTREMWDTFINNSFSIEKMDLNKRDFLSILKKKLPWMLKGEFDFEKWEAGASECDLFSTFPTNVCDEERLLLVKIFRPYFLNSSITKYCCDKIGVDSLSPIAETLNQHWNEYLKDLPLPIMLVTQPENDPGNEIQALAEGLKCRLVTMSLGGDNQNVLDILRASASEGQWICLKNLHLAVDFLPSLERELDEILYNSHINFRLWLTTEKCNSFSPLLIERSFKIMCEAPTGVKENVKQTFARWEEQPLEITKAKVNNSKKQKLFFILAWTHAILQERCSFGSHGWRLKYDFTTGDIVAAGNVIEIFHDAHDALEIIRFFLLHFVYGGKINNCCDQKILKAYVENYFCDDVLEGHKELFPGFRIKQIWDSQSCHRAIRDIPVADTPSLFGLPDNIFKSIQRNVTFSIMEKLQKLESKHSKNEYDLYAWYDIIKPTIQHWSNISCDMSNVNVKKSTSFFSDDPFQQFLRSEQIFAQNISMKVSSSIKLLQRVHNSATDSNFIGFQEMRNSLVDGLVPLGWKELYSGPSNVITWLTEVTKKSQFLGSFHISFDIFKSNQLLSLSNFFNIPSLLCALRHRVSLEKNCALDDVIIFSEFDSPSIAHEDNNVETYSICISGLLLRGCTVEEDMHGNFILHPMRANTPDYQKSPTIRINFCQVSTLHLTKKSETLFIPVYKNSTSEEILFGVSIGCDKTATQSWILAGVTLYLEL